MINSVEGVYRDGKVILTGEVPDGTEGRVIVTFVGSDNASLEQRGIDPAQAADLHRRLGTFADDWQSPDMDVYDAI